MSDRKLLDELMVQAEQSPSFKEIMSDGIVTGEEISKLSSEIEKLMEEIETTFSEKDISLVSELITKLNVLHAVSLLNNNKL